jgi:hypothetical protein
VKNKIQFAVFAILIAPFFQAFAPGSTYSLGDAIAKGKIKATYVSNPNGTHYTKPLKIVLANLTGEQINVIVENATTFYPDDPNYQNLIVTCSGTIPLAPSQTKETEIYAMCTESTDSAPGTNEMHYTIGPAAGSKLAGLTKMLEEKKWFDATGQNAVWAIANNESPGEVYGPDKAQQDALRQYVSNITGKPIPKDDETNYENDFYAQPKPDRRVEGMIGFSYSWKASVSVGLFNEQNVLVRELYNNTALPPGTHKVNYAFDNSVYTDSVYYARLICDGEMKINRKIELY